MRLLRFRCVVAVAAQLTALLACNGNEQGYYGPCNEPAGVVLDCPPGDDEGPYTVWDACRKLAVCGVIHTRNDDEADPRDFEGCVDELLDAVGRDPNATILACIQSASCPDLARVTDEAANGQDPYPPGGDIEGIVGWCGRLDPR